MNPSKKYIAYYRKSTDSEDRQVLSLDGQQETVTEYAIRHGLKIVEHIKESFSAKKPGRPKFSEMVQRARKGEFDGIISYKLDRLTRNYADLGALAGLIEQDIEIHDTSYGVYKDDSNSFIMIGVNTAIASAKIKGLSEDTRRGLQQKRNMGWFPGYAPTGYLNNKLDKVIEIDPERAPFIRRAFKLYDTGLYSLKELGKKLYDEGFRTRSNSGHISKTTIEGILKNPFYYGFFRNREHVFQGKHTPLVSRGLWSRVQDRLMAKNQRKGRTKLAFTYRGLLSCGECGCSITAETHKGHVYYRCSKSRGKCSQSYMREEELESQLSRMLDPIMMDVRTFELIMSSLKELYREDKAHQDKVTKSLRIKLARLKEEKKRLFRKMINDEVDDQDMYNDLREDIDNQMVEIGMQIANLTQGTHDWLEQSSNLLRVARHVKQLFLEGTSEQKQKVVETVSSNRILKDGKLGFIYKKPFDMLVKGLESTDWLRIRYDLRTFFIYNEWQCSVESSKHAAVV